MQQIVTTFCHYDKLTSRMCLLCIVTLVNIFFLIITIFPATKPYKLLTSNWRFSFRHQVDLKWFNRWPFPLPRTRCVKKLQISFVQNTQLLYFNALCWKICIALLCSVLQIQSQITGSRDPSDKSNKTSSWLF